MTLGFEERWKIVTGSITAIIVAAGTAFGGYQYLNTGEGEIPLDAKVHQNTTDIEVVGNAVQQLKQSANLTRWIYLRNLRKSIGLGPNQYKEYCLLGSELFGEFKCPVYDGRKPRND